MMAAGVGVLFLAALVAGLVTWRPLAYGSPDVTVRVGSGTGNVSEDVIVPLEAFRVTESPVGAITVDVEFDPAVLDATACQKDPNRVFDSALCNPDFDRDGVNPDRARFAGISAGGVSGDLLLANLRFHCVGAGISSLNVVVVTLTDPNGVPITLFSIQDGEITCNEPPVCGDTSQSTDHDTPVSFSLPCSDPDGGPGPLTCSVVTPPSNGSVTLSDCLATYTPNASFSGQDSFTYKANDGADDSNVATATITVAPPNVDYAAIRLQTRGPGFRNPAPGETKTKIHVVVVKNVGNFADGPATVSLSVVPAHSGCPAATVNPVGSTSVTLEPGRTARLLFEVVYSHCTDDSPPVDYNLTGTVSAPGDANPLNNTQTTTQDARGSDPPGSSHARMDMGLLALIGMSLAGGKLFRLTRRVRED
jgi:hypothetical protein